ncbi:interferon-induced protein 44 [Danio rerio]|uniref:Interferon-induced protein 44 n=4 Tax=Danio rerio TaxID=7955 RepID=A0AC58JG48_DANRE|nr:interferon-induced protein 44 isoform X2 [Danio rerio]|eukprot:XP_001345981.5 interferon-induced protein 44 isoform X2 [Danio rerio]
MGPPQSKYEKKHLQPSGQMGNKRDGSQSQTGDRRHTKDHVDIKTESQRKPKKAMSTCSYDSGYAVSTNEPLYDESNLDERRTQSSSSWERPNLVYRQDLDMSTLRYAVSANEPLYDESSLDERRTQSSSSRERPDLVYQQDLDMSTLRLSQRSSGKTLPYLDDHSQSQKTRPTQDLEKPWRKFDWGQKQELLRRLEQFSPSNPTVTNIKVLVAGQVGAGKSSFINSVNSAFQGEIARDALADATTGGSFTRKLESYRIRSADGDLPFEICDVMGLEPEILSGCHPADIISTIYGHVNDGYKYKDKNPLFPEDEHYKRKPSMSDKAFCLVYVIDASTIQFTDDRLIEKLRIIRNKISEEGIPQVVVMTKVDEACPLVRDDLRKIYTSKKIKEKMEFCSGSVGVPMNSIFPVKNYSDEIDTDDDVDVLILKAFDQIVRWANSRLRRAK